MKSVYILFVSFHNVAVKSSLTYLLCQPVAVQVMSTVTSHALTVWANNTTTVHISSTSSTKEQQNKMF